MSKNQNNNIPYTVSQNFLTCRKTIDRLIRIARLQNSDTVLEIGAGKGHITNALSDKCKKIISYEIDKHLYDRLKYQISSNVCLRHGDFLKCRLPHEQYKVFANIPFSITTSIIKWNVFLNFSFNDISTSPSYVSVNIYSNTFPKLTQLR